MSMVNKVIAGFLVCSLALAVVIYTSLDVQRSDAVLVSHSSEPLGQVLGMRRLTEAQYRNAIGDIFGSDIEVAGRFEPIVRPAYHLAATGASSAGISPAGLEQFDAVARAIAAQVLDESHRKTIVACTPRHEARPDPDCAGETLASIGRYVFRRPLTGQEQAIYVKMAAEATTHTGSFYSGLELALAAMLISPDFLYVVETGEPDRSRPGEWRLDSYSRAARLSFVLWNTTPNDGLLQAAADGRLEDAAQLTAIAQQMITSPRLEDGVRAFFSDMLWFEKFDQMAKDPLVYPRFNAAVASALPEQMLRTIIDHLVIRGADYRELFTTRRTFMNRPLGALYNVPVRTRSGWEPFEFGADDDRAGLLGQAGFLALYSHSGRSSPTLRGRAVRELLLCQPVPNPPGNVNFTAVQDIRSQVLRTARARLNAHTSDPLCAGCHRITDPIGLPLERFDGIGAWRHQENDAEIDTRGMLEGVSFVGMGGLGKTLASMPAATQCVVRRAYEYAVGRSVQDDAATLAALNEAFAADHYRIPALFLRIATLPEAYRVHGTADHEALVLSQSAPINEVAPR